MIWWKTPHTPDLFCTASAWVLQNRPGRRTTHCCSAGTLRDKYLATESLGGKFSTQTNRESGKSNLKVHLSSPGELSLQDNHCETCILSSGCKWERLEVAPDRFVLKFSNLSSAFMHVYVGTRGDRRHIVFLKISKYESFEWIESKMLLSPGWKTK